MVSQQRAGLVVRYTSPRQNGDGCDSQESPNFHAVHVALVFGRGFTIVFLSEPGKPFGGIGILWKVRLVIQNIY